MQAVGKNTFVYVCPKGDPSVNSEFQHYVNTPAKEFVDNKIMSGIMKPKNNSIEYVEVDFIISKYSVYFWDKIKNENKEITLYLFKIDTFLSFTILIIHVFKVLLDFIL